jgi:hypothetical protein
MPTNTNTRNATAIGLICLGVLFLFAQLTGFSFLGLLWPLFIVAPGLIFLYFAFTGDRNTAGLAVPGAIITGTGGILFYQNLTGHWASWAYIWALYPVFVGLALVFIGRRTGSESTERTGDGFVKWGLIAFAGLWVLFEILIFGGNNWIISTLLPLALIAAGVYLLIQNNAREKAKITYSGNGHRKNHSEDLQEKINAALAEDDDQII